MSVVFRLHMHPSLITNDDFQSIQLTLPEVMKIRQEDRKYARPSTPDSVPVQLKGPLTKNEYKDTDTKCRRNASLSIKRSSLHIVKRRRFKMHLI